MSLRRNIAALIGIAALAASPTGFAQGMRDPDTGFYIGGSIGQSKVDFCGDAFPGANCDEKDTTWKVFAGYQINRNFALELGYIDLGEVSVSDPTGRIGLAATAWEFVGIGSIPIADRFFFFGKIGLYRAETELNAAAGTLVVNADESNTDLTFGLGLRYDFTRNLGVRLEWQRYSDVKGPSILDEGDIDVMSVGVIWRF
jgi:OOP family OmpA-OmpF porin